jgi:hypothetical protein
MPVDAKWSKYYMLAIGPYTLILLKAYVDMVSLRPTGPLGESGGSSVGKGGESDVETQDLQGCSPRLCWLRADGLVPASKY